MWHEDAPAAHEPTRHEQASQTGSGGDVPWLAGTASNQDELTEDEQHEHDQAGVETLPAQPAEDDCAGARVGYQPVAQVVIGSARHPAPFVGGVADSCRRA